MRTLYSILFYLLIPFILLRLLWRSLKAPEYRKRWAERFAFYNQSVAQNVVWFHAVSVGEAEALFPLVRLFQDRCPQIKVLITTTTPTGSARVRAVLGETVEHVYLPYDVPIVVARFMRSFKPILAVIVETEIWPNLFSYCGENRIPLYVINARLSDKSARGYKKISALIKPALQNIKLVAAQSQEDAERYILVGAKPECVITVGNIKFDIEIPQILLEAGRLLKSSAFKDRFVLLAASTHCGEERQLLDIYQTLKINIPELLLIIAPRHLERFEEVYGLCEQFRVKTVKRTSDAICDSATEIYLADTMGELKLLYAAADLAFVGGSLVPVGGHNLLEAAAARVPVLFGPYMSNFKEIAVKVLAADAAVQCHDIIALMQEIQLLYSDNSRRQTLIENGNRFLFSNRGATQKLYSLLSKEVI